MTKIAMIDGRGRWTGVLGSFGPSRIGDHGLLARTEPVIDIISAYKTVTDQIPTSPTNMIGTISQKIIQEIDTEPANFWSLVLRAKS